jgi:hypothetical protein
MIWKSIILNICFISIGGSCFSQEEATLLAKRIHNKYIVNSEYEYQFEMSKFDSAGTTLLTSSKGLFKYLNKGYWLETEEALIAMYDSTFLYANHDKKEIFIKNMNQAQMQQIKKQSEIQVIIDKLQGEGKHVKKEKCGNNDCFQIVSDSVLVLKIALNAADWIEWSEQRIISANIYNNIEEFVVRTTFSQFKPISVRNKNILSQLVHQEGNTYKGIGKYSEYSIATM